MREAGLILGVVATCSLGAGHPSMSLMPPGVFKPPFAKDSGLKVVPVPAFRLDNEPVTQGDFAAFVKSHAEWRRSGEKTLFRDKQYLKDWANDTTPAAGHEGKPVTWVSWHAAKAYCAAQDKRLPTTMEWERAAETRAEGLDSLTQLRQQLDWFGRPAGLGLPDLGTGTRHAQGVRDLYGLIWEWTSDYKSWGYATFSRSTAEDSARFCGGGGNTSRTAEYATFMRYGFRMSLEPHFTVASLGFRCAQDAEPPLPEGSLYQTASVWQNDDGRTLRLAELRGKPRLVSLFFSRCESVCPMLLGQLKSLERDLPADLARQFGFVMVSFDVERDSLQSLKAYREHMGLAPSKWLVLRGNADDTRELALLLGVEYQPGGRGQIDHNGLIALLDAEGRVVKKVSGIQDRSAFISEMRTLAGPNSQSRAINNSR